LPDPDRPVNHSVKPSLIDKTTLSSELVDCVLRSGASVNARTAIDSDFRNPV